MNPGILCALAAAALFGASTPFAKNLIGDIPPIVLAGLLYAGSGVGLSILLLVRLVARRASTAFAWPARGEWGPLLASIVFGGMLGPVLVMQGLAQLAASTASLLLNLETASRRLSRGFCFARISIDASFSAWLRLLPAVSCFPRAPRTSAVRRVGCCSSPPPAFAGRSTTI